MEQKHLSCNTRFLILLSIFFGTTAHSFDMQCPHIVLDSKNENYTGFKPKKLKISTLYVGKLGDTSSALAPDQQQKNKKLIQTWDLTHYHNQKQSIWLECQYFETAIKLQRKIPKDINYCKRTFTLDALHNAQIDRPLVCRRLK